MTRWPFHHPLELDHKSTHLVDICVNGESVSWCLADGLWEQAEEYIREHYAPEIAESAQKIIERIDRKNALEEKVR